MTADTPRTPPPRRRPRPSRATIIRRRIVALLILITLVALLVFGVTKLVQAVAGFFADDPEPPPAQTVEKDPEPKACGPGLVTVVTKAQDFMVGEEGELTVTFTNTTDEPCLIETGGEDFTFIVTDGTNEVWNAQTCGDQPDKRPLLLAAEEDAQLKLFWDGTRAVDTCDSGRPKVDPGSYRYTVTLKDGSGDWSPVEVTPTPAQAAEQAAEQEASQGDDGKEDAGTGN